MTPNPVKREDVEALEKQIEWHTGLRLPVGKKMQEAGIWKIEDD